VLALAAIATSGSGADLTAASVTLAKIANQADLTILGNNSGGAGPPIALTAAQTRTVLALAAIATSGSGADLAAGTVALAALANLANATVIGRNTAGTGVPEAVTMAQLAALLTAGNNGVGQAYYTADLNLLATSSGNALIPAKTGFYFVAQRIQCLTTSRTGTATGNLVFTIGNDGSELNLVPAVTFAAATFNTATAPGNFTGNATNQTTTTAAATTPYTLKITTAVGGSSVLTGRIVIFGAWVPV
jgi:hypothetical protein